MSRVVLTAALVFTASAARGQDMPVYSIVPDGNGWRVAADPGKPRTVAGLTRETDNATGKLERFWVPNGGRRIEAKPAGLTSPTAAALTPDGGTLYVGDKAGRAVWAYRVHGDAATDPAPYCPLRLRPGAKGVEVTAVTVDAVGRVYAATPENVQVFDPTGRPSAVLRLPTADRPDSLGWDGPELLAVWAGGVKYTRKVNVPTK